ncbi:MAG: SAM-dependent methyltransferase [Sphingomonas sp.]|nr:SAM-dependent methyltransferase [Sphingomonas sp.]
MDACNAYYYATRDPLGAAGDFTTAPEISQMFGELVGACLADCWARAGRPSDAIYVELGPGRGTLAADALRVMNAAGLEPDVHFVETSPALSEAQLQLHPDADWHADLPTIPEGGPLLLVANEFLDALPIRQFVDGAERRIKVAAGGLAFDRDGTIVEDSPARAEAVSEIAKQLDGRGGVALIVDYGHERSAPGDTLQSVRGHGFAPVLANPGEQDLTSHVDFEAVAKASREVGASVTSLTTQGQWLGRLGIAARAEALARAQPERTMEIDAARCRLCDRAQMGELFKVIALHSPNWPQPAGFG